MLLIINLLAQPETRILASSNKEAAKIYRSYMPDPAVFATRRQLLNLRYVKPQNDNHRTLSPS